MNITPLLRVRGTVRRSLRREVEAREAKPAEFDAETGRKTREAVEAREAYESVDVTLDTNPGGFVTVVCTPAALEALGGEIPADGSEVEWPIRAFVTWVGRLGNRYATVGYSLAHDVYADENSAGTRYLSSAGA